MNYTASVRSSLQAAEAKRPANLGTQIGDDLGLELGGGKFRRKLDQQSIRGVVVGEHLVDRPTGGITLEHLKGHIAQRNRCANAKSYR